MKRRIQSRLTTTHMEEAIMPSPLKTTTTNTLQSRMSPTHKTRDNTTMIMTINPYCSPTIHMGRIRKHLDLVFQAPTMVFNQAQIPVQHQSDDGRLSRKFSSLMEILYSIVLYHQSF